MSEGVVFSIFGGLFVSCFIAAVAGRSEARLWWGILGPFGWIIAAIHAAADQIAPPKPGAAAEEDLLVGQFRATCQTCGVKQPKYAAPGRNAGCSRCGCNIQDASDAPPNADAAAQ